MKPDTSDTDTVDGRNPKQPPWDVFETRRK